MVALLRYFLMAFVVSVAGISVAQAQDVPVTPHFEKHVEGSRTIIVFVHGIFGDGRSTWTSGDFYWPKEIASDPTFAGADVFVYAYPTGLWATFSIDELAENLRLYLTLKDMNKYDNVVFLTHSMGGLVVRDYLLKNREIAARTKFIYFYSTPTSGSEIAGVITLAVKVNPQLSKMVPMKPEDFLADQVRQWNDAQFKIGSYCAYEKRATLGVLVVEMKSSALLCNKPLDPIDANHIDIVKPDRPESASYRAFANAYTGEIGAAGISQAPSTASTEQSCLPAKILATLNRGSLPTKDGNGNTVGSVSDVSLAIVESCKPPNERSTRYLLKYGYYNGSGTWRGEQHMNITLAGDKKFPLKVVTVPLDRGRCIYGGPEPRSAEGDLKDLGYLVKEFDISITAVSGVQTGC